MLKSRLSLTLCLCLCVFGIVPALAQTSTPSSANQQIAFMSAMDGNAEIYVINADGTGLLRLTYNLTLDERPVWSPDGKQIAFVNIGADFVTKQIMVIDADGSDLRPLVTDQALGADFFAWSHDGKQVAYSTLVGPGNQDIFVADIATGTSRNLTNGDLDMDLAPLWSPDDKELLFDYEGKQSGMAVLDATTGAKRLLNLPYGVGCSDWSHDGKQLLCFGSEGIFWIDAHNEQDKTPISMTPAHPYFSPDDQKIAYIQTDVQTSPATKITSQIGMMDADGTHDHLLVEGIDGFLTLAWSPDSQRLAYYAESSPNGFFDLYLMNADGSNLHKLVEKALEDKQPAWRPLTSNS